MKRFQLPTKREWFVAAVPAFIGWVIVFNVAAHYPASRPWAGGLGAITNATIWGFLRHKFPPPEEPETNGEQSRFYKWICAVFSSRRKTL